MAFAMIFAKAGGLPGGNSEREPPDTIPNSEVKPLSADGSAEFLRVRVGHRQALKHAEPRNPRFRGFFVSGEVDRPLTDCRHWRRWV